MSQRVHQVIKYLKNIPDEDQSKKRSLDAARICMVALYKSTECIICVIKNLYSYILSWVWKAFNYLQIKRKCWWLKYACFVLQHLSYRNVLTSRYFNNICSHKLKFSSCYRKNYQNYHWKYCTSCHTEIPSTSHGNHF